MKKSLLALAVLGTFASVASAQSSVTLSGTVDASIQRKGASSTVSASDWTLGGSQSNYNSITLSGTEDLGGGMRAFFALNHRFTINSGAVNTAAGTVFWRNASVGLGGAFGDVRLGRILMPLQDMNGGFDPFATGTVGSTHTGGINATIRANNAIYYRSPSLSGLSVNAAIAAGEGQIVQEIQNNFGSGQGLAALAATGEHPIGFSVRYAAGPLNVGVAYDKNYLDVKTTGLYGSYDLGAVKLYTQFEKGDSRTGNTGTGGWVTTSENLKNWSFGLTAPLGPVLLRAGYVRTNSNLAKHDGSKFGFGGDYNLSKRTNLYADVAKFTGDRFKAGVINTSVNQTKAQFDIGVTHRF